MKRFLASVFALVAMGASTAKATVLYDSGTPSTTISPDGITNGNIVADSFTLSGAATLTGFDFYANEAVESLDFAILSSPDFSKAGASVTPTNQFLGYSYPDDLVTAAISPMTLSAGTYYLQLGNAVGRQQPNSTAWAGSSAGTSDAVGDAIGNGQPTNAFQILGAAVSAAPESSTWALMIAGLAVIGLTLRRKRRIRAKGASPAWISLWLHAGTSALRSRRDDLGVAAGGIEGSDERGLPLVSGRLRGGAFLAPA